MLTLHTRQVTRVDLSTSGALHYWMLSKERSIYKTLHSIEINNIALAPAMLLDKANLSLLLLVQQAAQVLVEIDVSAVVSDAVVAVGVRPPAHLLGAHAVADEQVDERGSVLVVHVVVAETVLDAEATEHGLEAGCVADGGGLVAGGIGLGDAHVSLSVHGVVEAPVGHWCGDEAEGEWSGICALSLKNLGGQETTEGPAPESDMVRVSTLR